VEKANNWIYIQLFALVIVFKIALVFARGTVYKSRVLNVSQLFTLPVCKPVLNHLARCALVPWVKLSGRTWPVD
jgi:hypothetical protein